MAPNWAASSTTTGTCSGPAAAKPTKTAISIRGSTSSSGCAWTSKRKPGRRRVRTAIALLHLKALIGQHQLLHRHVGTLGVERAAGVLDDARPQQLPGLHDGGMVLVLELDR